MDWHSIVLWEQPFIDLWSIPHTFLGIVAVFITVLIGFSYKKGLLITMFIAIGWELIEPLLGISEHGTNQIIDILLSLVGFGLTGFFVKKYNPQLESTRRLLTLTLLIMIGFSFVGWLGWYLRNI